MRTIVNETSKDGALLGALPLMIIKSTTTQAEYSGEILQTKGVLGTTRTTRTRRVSSKITATLHSIKVRFQIKHHSFQEEGNRDILHTKRGFLFETRAGVLGTFRVPPGTTENGVATIMVGATTRTTFKQKPEKTISRMSLYYGFVRVEALLLGAMKIPHRQGSAADTRLSVV